MKLLWIKIDGFKRFKNQSMLNLFEKVIALIGPNEAGKTSILDAIAHLNNEDCFSQIPPNQELSRGKTIDSDHSVVSACYILDNNDRKTISSIRGTDNVRKFTIRKYLNGSKAYDFDEEIKRDRRKRHDINKQLATVKESKHLKDLNYTTDDGSTIQEKLIDIQKLLISNQETYAPEDIDYMRSFASLFNNAVDDNNHPKYITSLQGKIRELCEFELQPHPKNEAIEELKSLLPEYLLFSENDRLLSSDYDISSGNFPQALVNLANLAGLDLNELRLAINAPDPGQVETLLAQANDELERIFKEKWGQSGVYTRLGNQGSVLQVFVGSTNTTYVNITERSEGLKWFVALVSFLSKRPDDEKTILLIDEAESHLHYEAQSDLIKMFHEQQVADQVIYTTHSIGCLPEDLGTGIRIIKPDSDTTSKIDNWFWISDRPGFSPILFGMGARTLAFIAIREAVLVEGISDLILLPKMFREATEEDHLGFQIIPGLANANNDYLPIIAKEAPKIAYLLDDDESGRQRKDNLIEQGVSSDRIFLLPKSTEESIVTEDFIDSEVYLNAVNSYILSEGTEDQLMELDDLHEWNRPHSVTEWLSKHGIKNQSKRIIAYNVLEQIEDEHILRSDKKSAINALVKSIKEVLETIGETN